MTDFAAQRADTSASITELERLQGAALLDGKDFDAATLADARTRLEAIDQAAAEAERRAREQDTAVKDARRAELRQDAALIAADYTTALDAADAAAQALQAALKRIIDSARTLSMLAIHLGIRPSQDLAPEALEKLLSQLVGRALVQNGWQRRFGYLEWPGAITTPTFAALAKLIPAFEEGA